MAVLLWTGVTVTRAGGELVLDGSLCPVVVVDRLAVAAPEDAPLALGAAVRGARMRRVWCGTRRTGRRGCRGGAAVAATRSLTPAIAAASARAALSSCSAPRPADARVCAATLGAAALIAIAVPPAATTSTANAATGRASLPSGSHSGLLLRSRLRE